MQILDWTTDTPPIPASASKADAPTYITPHARELLAEIVDPDGARIIAVSGGVGCGKSYAIAQAIKTVALTRPGSAILVSAGSLTLLMSVLKKRCDEVFGHLAEFVGGMIHPRYEFKNGSVAEFRPYTCHGNTAESTNSWEGRDCHLLIVDEFEQLPATALDHSFQRCRLSASDARGVRYDPTVVWIGRPGVIDHWVRKAEEMRETGRPVAVLRPRTFDNPVLWEYDKNGNPKNAYLENMRASLPLAEFNCVTGQIPGSEMPTRGAVYSDFEVMAWPEGNILDWTYDGRPCTLAIDLGRAHPAVLFITTVEVNGVDVDVIFDELQPDDVLTEGIIPLIHDKGHNIAEAVVDPAGRTRNAQTGKSDIQLLRKSADDGGLGCPVFFTLDKEKVRINAGISKTRALILNAQGHRRLTVTKQLWDASKHAPPLARTIRSLLLYSWDNAGKATSATKGGPGEPDHVADALRYWVIRYRWHLDRVRKMAQRTPPTPLHQDRAAAAIPRRKARFSL